MRTYRLTSATEVARLTALASADGGDAPGSRYGTYVRSFAPFAVGAFIAFAESNGVDDGDEVLMDSMLSMVVNNSATPAEWIADSWDVIPRGLQQELGGLRYVRSLAS